MIFPTLPPNSSLKIPSAPTKGDLGRIASDIHRLAGKVEPRIILHRITVEAGMLMLSRSAESPDVLAAVDWLLAHGRQWAALMAAETVAASMKVAA